MVKRACSLAGAIIGAPRRKCLRGLRRKPRQHGHDRRHVRRIEIERACCPAATAPR